MDKKAALAALTALGQETRLDTVRLLVRAGPKGMLDGEIGAALAIRQNTMSTNLRILLAAGLVRSAREGRGVRHVADMDGMTALLSVLMEDCCGGRPALCQLAPDTIACAS